jgi:hypothetical protein
VLTQQDFEDYGQDFVNFSRRAALEALGPEVRALQQQNHQLRAMAQRAQNADIQRTLDQSIPDWRAIYRNPAFAAWLSAPDDYSGAVRSQLMRNAVDNGDAGRVVQFYKGFLAEAGHQAPAGQQRAYQSRPAATGGPRVYSRQEIASLYERRRKGLIDAATWAKWEPAIIKAANEGRIAGALDRDGNKLTELR